MDQHDNTCPVCHEIISVFAIGQCDHPICCKCSTRMRVLCEQMYCAICRTDLPEVLFVKKRDKFIKINRRGFIPHRRYKVFFEDFDAEETFKKLQENRCKICKDRPVDKTFYGLKDHMRREHTLFCCDLCQKHLRIFSFEKKFYNRKDLATHRRTGDEDDKSYKGHPLCKFCDERYMDNDELLRHLRKDHYFCHFCDEASNEYYGDYEDLKQHFRVAHYLCEQDNCINVQFTNAFRTEIDMKAHLAKEHYHRMNKAQVKETRTIDVGFQFAPRMKGRARGATGLTSDDYEDVASRGHSQGHGYRGRGGQRGGYESSRAREERLQVEKAREASLQEALRNSEREMREIERKRREAQEKEERKLEEHRLKKEIESIEKDFPSLGGAPSVPAIVPQNLGKTTTTKKSKPQSARAPGRLNSKEYPTLSSGASNHGNTNSSHSSQKVSRNTDRDSPVQDPVTTPVVATSNVQTVPQSILDSMRKETTVVPKRAPKKTSEDFPTLGGGAPRSRKNDASLVSLGVWSAKSKKNELNMGNSSSNTKQENIPTSLSSLGQIFCDAPYQSQSGKSSSPLQAKSKSGKSKANSSEQTSSKVKAPPPKTRDKQPEPDPVEEAPKKNKKKKKQKEQKEEPQPKPSSEKPSSAGSGKEGKTKKVKNSDVIGKVFSEQSDRDSGIESSSGSVDSATIQAFNDNLKVSETVISTSTESSKVSATSYSTTNMTNGEAAATSDASLGCIAVGLLGAAAQQAPVLDDFPSLNSASSVAPPPGFKPPAPPGFGTGSSSSGSRPPPGFTTKGQETKATPLSSDKGNFVFSKPNNFSDRNKELVQNVSILLNNDQERFTKFKSYSGSFRQGTLNAYDYYIQCQQLLGQENFSLIITELIALLPDIDKQQDLLSVHRDSLREAKPVLRISGKAAKAPWSVTEEFKTCPTCRQVLLQDDYNAHLKGHGDAPDFPTLGTRGHHPGFLGQGSWIKAK